MAEYLKARPQSVNDETLDGERVEGGVRAMYARYPGAMTELGGSPIRSARVRWWIPEDHEVRPLAFTTPEQENPELIDRPAGGRPVVASIDGRTARAMRTRQAIVDATLALVEAGDIRPTAPRIAEQAGVSVRSIFQHFDDLETLFYALAERTMERVSAMRVEIDPAAPRSQRLSEYLTQRCAINEALTPINRAAVVYASTSPTIRERFEGGHELVSDRLAAVFAEEFAAAGDQDRKSVV